MKRSFMLLCSICAVTSSYAQSSVTISGTVDVGLGIGKGSLTHRNSVISGGNATSKLIFRGVEDLGGGMSAGFWLESGLLADSGVGQPSNTNNQPTGTITLPAGSGQGLTFNRRSDLWLAGSLGQVHLGRLWAPAYEAYTGKYDPFALSVGIGINYANSINSTSGLIRASNDVAYYTPRFAGFGAHVHRWFGENASGTPTSKDGSGNGLRLYYDNGPFSAILALTQTTYAAGDAKTRVAGAVYDFGPVRTAFNINRDELGAIEQRGYLVGAWVPVGIHEIKASYSMFRSNVTALNPESSKIALGYVHNLSKQVALYATLAHVRNKNGATSALNGSTTASNRSSNGLDLGLRHHF